MKLFEITEKTSYFNKINFIVKTIQAKSKKEAIKKENEKINNINIKYKNIKILDFSIKEIVLKKIFLNNHNDIIKESNTKNLKAINKDTNIIYNIDPVNAWEYPFIKLVNNSLIDKISIDFLMLKYNICEALKSE